MNWLALVFEYLELTWEFLWPFLPGILLGFLFFLPSILFRLNLKWKLILFVPVLLAEFGLLGYFQFELFARSALYLFMFLSLPIMLYPVVGCMRLNFSFGSLPLLNTFYLLAAAFLSLLLGAAGATILLAQPLFQANQNRRYAKHVAVFFILIVCNANAFLTPLAGGHIFFGTQHGLHPEWLLKLFPIWLLQLGLFIFLFIIFDKWMLRREGRPFDPGRELSFDLQQAIQDRQVPQSLLHRTCEYLETSFFELRTGLKFIFLLLAVVVLYAAGRFGDAYYWREVTLILLGLAAFFTTPREERAGQEEFLGPLLNLGFFYALAFPAVLMVPVVLQFTLDAGMLDLLDSPLYLFFVSGVLSMFLDNTLVMLAGLELGVFGLQLDTVGVLTPETGSLAGLLKATLAEQKVMAVLLGTAIFGGVSYGGNILNLHLRVIADQNGIGMPGLFRYFLYALVPGLFVGCVVYFTFFPF